MIHTHGSWFGVWEDSMQIGEGKYMREVSRQCNDNKKQPLSVRKKDHNYLATTTSVKRMTMTTKETASGTTWSKNH